MSGLWAALAVIALVLFVTGIIGLIQEILTRRSVARVREELRQSGPTCAHIWRSIVPPYSRQCRRCGTLDFREDDNGDMPDGLREYLEAITRGELPPPIPPPAKFHPYVPPDRSTLRCIHDVNLSDHCRSCRPNDKPRLPDVGCKICGFPPMASQHNETCSHHVRLVDPCPQCRELEIS
jgi:hypothetical protein